MPGRVPSSFSCFNLSCKSCPCSWRIAMVSYIYFCLRLHDYGRSNIMSGRKSAGSTTLHSQWGWCSAHNSQFTDSQRYVCSPEPFAGTRSWLTHTQIYTYLKQRNNDDGRPEYRLPLLMVGAISSPIGILIYSWTAQNRVLWIGPDIGVAVFGFGSVMTMICTSGYMIECFPLVAASAVAAATCLRSIAAFVS